MNMVARYLNWSYRKVGGLHFIKLGRFGASFYVSRRCPGNFEGEARAVAPMQRHADHIYATAFREPFVEHRDAAQMQAMKHKFY